MQAIHVTIERDSESGLDSLENAVEDTHLLNTPNQQNTLLHDLKPYGTLVSFSRHSLIYAPDEPAQSLYVLYSGQVNLYMISPGGRILTLQLIEPLEPFGQSMLTGNQTYDTFAEATTVVQTLELSQDDLHKAMEHQPALTLKLIAILEQYMAIVSRRLDELAFKSVPARLASVLLDMADTAASHGLQPRIPRRTHQQLAEMTNAYRETVTKVIKQFRTDRLLDVDRTGITLLNTTRLRELAIRG